MTKNAGSSLRDRLALAEFGLKVLVIILVIVAAFILKDPLVDKLTSASVQEIQAFGLRVSFVEDQIQKTISEARESDSGRWQDATAALPSIRSRLEAIGRLIPGSRMLWLDDAHPSSNYYERRIFQTLGIAVDMVRTVDEAMSLLRRSCYDVIISDVSRGGDGAAGLAFAADVHELPRAPKLVFYVLNLDRSRGTPAYSHGITNSPTELVHMVLDVLARKLDVRCATMPGG